jgi:hypothetical protein
MPDEKIIIEKDKDPSSDLEDTTPHKRVGFRVDDTKKIYSTGQLNNQVDQDFDR